MRRLGQGLLVILALVALGALGWGAQQIPSPQAAWQQPFPVAGKVGELVPTRHASVLLKQVETAAEVDLNGERVGTQGIWLIAHLEITPTTRPVEVSATQLRYPDGSFSRWPQTVGGGCARMQTGIPTACTLVFEADPAQLAGATLLVIPDPAQITLGGVSEGLGDSVAVVDLGWDEAGAAAAVSAALESWSPQ